MLCEKFDARANAIKTLVLDPLADSPALLPEEKAALMSPVKAVQQMQSEARGSLKSTIVDLSRFDSSANGVATSRCGDVKRDEAGAKLGVKPLTTVQKLKRMFGKTLVGIGDADDDLNTGQGERESTDVLGRDTGCVVHRELEVIIISGEHMPKMDLIGSCDAYCSLHYAGQHYKTTVQSNTYSPNWAEESFAFNVALKAQNSSSRTPREVVYSLSSSQDLVIHVFDYDLVGKDDKVGDALITAEESF
jgi:hypothetical protein